MRTTDRPHTRLGEAEVPHLALLDQILHRAGNVLDRDIRVHAVLVEQVDPVGAESAQRVVDTRPDRRRLAVGPARLAGRELEAELGRDHDVVAERLECLAD